jgi:hypothetical protein
MKKYIGFIIAFVIFLILTVMSAYVLFFEKTSQFEPDVDIKNVVTMNVSSGYRAILGPGNVKSVTPSIDSVDKDGKLYTVRGTAAIECVDGDYTGGFTLEYELQKDQFVIKNTALDDPVKVGE